MAARRAPHKGRSPPTPVAITTRARPPAPPAFSPPHWLPALSLKEQRLRVAPPLQGSPAPPRPPRAPRSRWCPRSVPVSNVTRAAVLPRAAVRGRVRALPAPPGRGYTPCRPTAVTAAGCAGGKPASGCGIVSVSAGWCCWRAGGRRSARHTSRHIAPSAPRRPLDRVQAPFWVFPVTGCPTSSPCTLLWMLVAFIRGQYWDQPYLTPLSVAWTVGSSAPSASFQMMSNCVVQLTCWRKGMPSRRTMMGLRGFCLSLT
ncbi:uncharacterized protein [Anser cygnoides]|uniref:uncharacterized protein n=1 Tax=Anser cygnoides TaxID=8845 RepID=UPI0034D2F93D